MQFAAAQDVPNLKLRNSSVIATVSLLFINIILFFI